MAASSSYLKPGLSLIENELWYAGPISERKAEQVLTKLGESGAFLVRDSLLPDADYVLSTNGGKDICHYPIKVSPTNECVFNNYTFTSLPDAIEFYTENRLGSVFLNKPDEPVVSEPVTRSSVGPKIRLAPVPLTNQRNLTPPPAPSPMTLDSTESKSPSMDSNELEKVCPPSPKANSSSPHVLENAWQNKPESNSISQSPQHFTLNTTTSNTEESSYSLNKSQTNEGDKQLSTEPSRQAGSLGGPVETSEVEHQKTDDDGNNPRDHTIPVEDKTHSPVKKEQSPSVYKPEENIENADSSAQTSHAETLKSPKDTKTEQINELQHLPSIGDKKRALEQKMKGKQDSGEQKQQRKNTIPPPVPKRTTYMDISKTESAESKEKPQELESVDCSPTNKVLTSVVKSSVKNTPPPSPKRLSIPQSFQQNDEEDDKVPKKITSPKRVIIPESLQVQPPPPPLATHPGLAKKEEERQQQQLLQAEQEKEKVQPQKSKKRLSFLRKKNKDKDKEKRVSTSADEPILLEDVERLKQLQQQQEVTTNPSPPRPKKVPGVPTPAMSPISLDASGGGAELESMFKHITKQDWHPEEEEESKIGDGSKITVSTTFGQHSVKVTQLTPEKVSDKRETPKEERIRKNSASDIGVSTFNPRGIRTTTLEEKETLFNLPSPERSPSVVRTEPSSPSSFTFTPSTSSVPTSPGTPSSLKPSSSQVGATSEVPMTDTSSFASNSSQSPRTPTVPSKPKQPSYQADEDSSDESSVLQSGSQQETRTPSSVSNTSTSPTHSAANNSFSMPPSSVPRTSDANQKENNMKKLPSKSQSSVGLPSRFVVKPTGNTDPLGPRHRSLTEVVPGLPTVAGTAPPTLPSVQESQPQDYSSLVPGVRVTNGTTGTRRNTAPANRKPEASSKAPSIGPMNSKRLGGKKKSSLFKKK